MAKRDNRTADAELDTPRGSRPRLHRGERDAESRDRFGRATEAIARGMGTPWFLVGLTAFCAIWIWYNVTAPLPWRFDSSDNGFTALTLILSLQASYAAPLILLAQNRQDDRDRVMIQQDRQRAERNSADVEYLAREVVSLRLQLRDMATKDFIRGELRSLLEDIDDQSRAQHEEQEAHRTGTGEAVAGSAGGGDAETRPADRGSIRSAVRERLSRRGATPDPRAGSGEH